VMQANLRCAGRSIARGSHVLFVSQAIGVVILLTLLCRQHPQFSHETARFAPVRRGLRV
jgi:hypothetical protein